MRWQFTMPAVEARTWRTKSKCIHRARMGFGQCELMVWVYAIASIK